MDMRNSLVKTAILAGGLALLAGPFATASAAFGDSTTGNFGFETVGPFDNFDTSSIGALLIVADDETPGGFNGYYQSSVVDFTEGFSSAPSPGLDAGEYEVTVTAEFSGFFSKLGEITLNPGGAVNMYLDDTPNSDLGTDTGFDDGTLIATGSFLSGNGVFTLFGPGTGVGGSTLIAEVMPSPAFDPMIEAIKATFTQQTNPAYASIPSVLGNAVDDNLLLQADGNIQLSAVPLPAAAWLFMSALVGLGFTARRRTV